MKLISREKFILRQGGRCVFPGFVSYVSATAPTLLHRSGWVDNSDTYDDFADIISRDGGRAWSAPVICQQKAAVAGGDLRYAENAAFFDGTTGRLLTFASRMLYPGGRHSKDTTSRWIEFRSYNPADNTWSAPEEWRFGPPQGLCISFCFPILTRAGRLLAPAYVKGMDAAGGMRKYPNSQCNLMEALTIIGARRPDGGFDWHAGKPLEIDMEKSCRGLGENTLAELADGRLAMIARGSNSLWPERPGYKWLAFSNDGGETWGDPKPLCFDDGAPAPSPGAGSALLRSIRNGRLYWIGNLAIDGVPVNGNSPRSPLVMAEVREEPFALRRDNLLVMDRRAADEPERLQLSNFRFYQERGGGDVILFLPRLYERDPKNFRDADYYRYRVALD